MSREQAIAWAGEHFDSGAFFDDLARRIAIPSTSQEAAFRPALYQYLEEEMSTCLTAMGFDVSIHENDAEHGGPFLVARRHEDDAAPTVLTYGHGDTVRGLEGMWAADRDPWTLEKVGKRWYGRGSADNKGQHSINIAALRAVLETRGRLGFNSTVLIETSEETGSAGLREFATAQRELLKADVLVGSDGPRLIPDRPTLFMGTRGAINFTLHLKYRDGGHHSGNWGGLLANPGTRLAHALTTLVGPKGEILVDALKPDHIPNSVRAALADCDIQPIENGPEVDPDWGEPGLSPAERVFAWNTFEILAFKTGNPDKVVNAVPPEATAWCQMRFTTDKDPATFLPAIRAHLDDRGFPEIEVTQEKEDFVMHASRLLPDHPWAQWAASSITRTFGEKPNILPNLGGSLPNDIFADLLGMPTLWVPHSYAACSQHAPNEHVLEPILREGLQIMAGIFWDLGSGNTP